MKARPLLFSGAMVRALLAGQKTQTRRAINPQPSTVVDGQVAYAPARPGYARALACPYGRPGDLLWVKETWQAQEAFDGLSPTEIGETWAEEYGSPWCPIRFLADGKCEGSVEQWQESPAGKTRVSIHMPRWASRLTLPVADVRIERLFDISDADAVAEGIVAIAPPSRDGMRHFGVPGLNIDRPTPARAYLALWAAINGEESLAANPWVWTITFSVLRVNVEDHLAAAAGATPSSPSNSEVQE